jgi:GNAT superfamily N-acetyltransferase
MRSACAEDLPTLLDLMADFYEEAGFVLDRPHAEEAFEALLADPDLGRVWLIEQGSTVVGHIVVTFVFAMEYGGVTAVVDDLYIRPAARGAGLGAAAVAEARRACAALGVRAMRVEVGRENAVAQAAYRHAGFAAVERLLMTLRLADPTHLVRHGPAGRGRKRMEPMAMTQLEDLPNIGPAIAAKLRRIGIRVPSDLIGRDPYALFGKLRAQDGERHDPCLLDVFISATRFMDGEPARPWWTYTSERKAVLERDAPRGRGRVIQP